MRTMEKNKCGASKNEENPPQRSATSPQLHNITGIEVACRKMLLYYYRIPRFTTGRSAFAQKALGKMGPSTVILAAKHV